MLPEEPLVPGEWYQFADRDLERAGRMLGDEDYSGAAFYIQQASEKCLKGFLLTKGWRLRKTHDLEVLLNEAVGHLPALEPFRKFCVATTGYYVIERYPSGAPPELTRQEIDHSIAQLKALIQIIRQSSP